MSPRVEIRAYPEAALPDALRLQVLRLQHEAWPGGEEPTAVRATHDPALAPLSLLLVVDGRVVSALDVLSKEIEHDSETFRASGLSTVVTDAALRGRGHGLALVRHARATIAASGADVGLFTCDTPLVPFYEAAGWRRLPGTTLVGGTPDDPLPSDRFDKATLGGFFTPHGRAHAAAFVGRRVALHSGTIDRLW